MSAAAETSRAKTRNFTKTPSTVVCFLIDKRHEFPVGSVLSRAGHLRGLGTSKRRLGVLVPNDCIIGAVVRAEENGEPVGPEEALASIFLVQNPVARVFVSFVDKATAEAFVASCNAAIEEAGFPEPAPDPAGPEGVPQKEEPWEPIATNGESARHRAYHTAAEVAELLAFLEEALTSRRETAELSPKEREVLRTIKHRSIDLWALLHASIAMDIDVCPNPTPRPTLIAENPRFPLK